MAALAQPLGPDGTAAANSTQSGFKYDLWALC